MTQVLTIARSGGTRALSIANASGGFPMACTACPADGGVLAGGGSCMVTMRLRCDCRGGDSLQSVSMVVTASAGESIPSSTGSVADWVYKIAEQVC
ncbi:hypothetical protein [Rhizobacter sp. P5_C2]